MPIYPARHRLQSSATGVAMRIFGFGQRADDESSVISPASDLNSGQSVGDVARRALLDQISDFLIDSRLNVSARNLVISHAAFSGTSLGLARQIAKRQMDRQPVTQEWLEDLITGDPEFADRQVEFERIAGKLDQSLASFSDATTKVSKATSTYGVELSRQAEAIENGDLASGDPAKLVALTRGMIERTRQLEEDMQRSQREVASLRRSLASARRDADLDHLTGLPNRRAFEAVFDREYRAAREAVDTLSIAICDIDKFKSINDTHGHDTGDRVIQAIAEVLARVSNERCHVARHGGEEFVLLFRGLTAEEARARLDGVRENFAQRHFIDKETALPIGHVTFSGGVANVFAFAEPRSALAAADQALYRAKEGGRNQICVAA